MNRTANTTLPLILCVIRACTTWNSLIPSCCINFLKIKTTWFYRRSCIQTVLQLPKWLPRFLQYKSISDLFKKNVYKKGFAKTQDLFKCHDNLALKQVLCFCKKSSGQKVTFFAKSKKWLLGHKFQTRNAWATVVQRDARNGDLKNNISSPKVLTAKPLSNKDLLAKNLNFF